MSSDITVSNEALRTIDSATLTGSWQALGDPLEHGAYMIKWKNNSNTDIKISYDGVEEHDIILAGDREVEDLNANHANRAMYFVRRRNTQVYVMGTAGIGSFYMVVMYAD